MFVLPRARVYATLLSVLVFATMLSLSTALAAPKSSWCNRPKPPPACTPPTPASTTRIFGPTVTATQLAAAIADNSLDTILLQPGTYHVGRLPTITAARTRLVTIRPESGTVVFDGDSVAGVQKLFLWFQGAANITFQDVTITDYAPLDTGVVIFTDGAHHITFDGVTMTGNRAPGTNDHLFYPAGYSAAPHDLVIKNSVLDGVEGGCVHLYHDPADDGYTTVLVENNDISHCGWGIINSIRHGLVTATGNRFSHIGENLRPDYPPSEMLSYDFAPYFAKINASGNTPNDNVTTSGW